MKKVILGFFFLAFGSTAALAQTTATLPPAVPVDSIAAPAPVVGPSLQFEEQKFDFGDIKPGDVVEHTFKFTNNGTLPLIIANVKTTCGCTATSFPKAPVMPGETASITARFNSAGKRGQQNKVITVESNAVQGSSQVIIATNIVAAN
ncbi:hypothetical protein TH63_08565 [Rufibacter radiotolerans]|uniref:DUF1573 domain-containing protein n=1 Tax=Rufibacter radiotolerans TaxID=1379910 RepID=A0A0H4W5K1_9BACT|nr:DUF1573 domain-containing protein [Rufibacter radiotolerans]AKQ45691.1 hypothetical protein TH63_08565 [Rufibacter radiotolerans]